MESLPTIDLCGKSVSRLICGGNPLSGISHVSSEMDRDMLHYYTMPNIQALFDECLRNGVNTFQSRGDRHQMRAFLEHRLGGGRIQWIAQTASEVSDIAANIQQIASFEPIAIYHHGTHTDNSWHLGRIDVVHDVVKAIRDTGLPAGVGTHIPDVLRYIEDRGWETDFYMTCFYNLARQYKSAPAVDRDAYARDKFPKDDPVQMTRLVREIGKPCLGFKIVAASRHCATVDGTREAFRFAFANLKPTDAVVVGMFQKYRNQVAENASIVRDLLGA